MEVFPSAVKTLSWNRDVRAKCDIFAAGRHIKTTSPLLLLELLLYMWAGRQYDETLTEQLWLYFPWSSASVDAAYLIPAYTGRDVRASTVPEVSANWVGELSITRCWIMERNCNTVACLWFIYRPKCQFWNTASSNQITENGPVCCSIYVI